MRFSKIVVLLILCFLGASCAKKATAPIPGSINTFDSYAFRALSDAQAALTGAKVWETCSDQKYPATVTFDGATYQCGQFQGPFPAGARAPLFKAEQSYDTAQAAWQTYHSLAGTMDPTALQNAINQLVADLTSFFTKAGGK